MSAATDANGNGQGKKRALEDEPKPMYHRDPSEWDKPAVPVVKAYRNAEFLNSTHARHIRILCEYEESLQRMRAAGIRATIMFFGSARSKDRAQYDDALHKASAALAATALGSDDHALALGSIDRLKKSEWMCDYMDKVRLLAKKLTEWSIETKYRLHNQVSGVSRNTAVRLKHEKASGDKAKLVYVPHSSEDVPSLPEDTSPGIYVCTGGGPGFMEAANRGAYDAGGKSIGMGITLPFEHGLNPYVSPELAFEYHYFFTRKFCMAYHMQALVVAPGGFGTFDELFELMTLKQTGKMQSDLPVVLFGVKYWKEVINWQALADSGTINQRDIDELLFTDDVEEAFQFVTEALKATTSDPHFAECGLPAMMRAGSKEHAHYGFGD
mmetsp:Transcript_2883/g.8993  ORF Transcript_2883/g.8993 Transcript_2883/m.8993 type:complete len:383 (+) Transcript_2883:53-1201(+)